MDVGRDVGATPMVSVAGLGPAEESRPYALAPVKSKGPWIGFGLLLQLIGTAAPVAYVLLKAKQQNVGGSLTLATVRLAWHDSVHSKAGLAILIVGAVVFALGAVLLARPFVKNWLVWLIAVPVAALAGTLLLGLGALIIAGIIVLASAGNVFEGGGGASSGRRKRKPS